MDGSAGVSLHRFTDLDDDVDLSAYVRALETFDGLPELQALKGLARTKAGPAGGQSVLDVGCGFGLETLRLARQVGSDGHVAGIDKSARFVAEARHRAASLALPIDYRVGDAEALPFPDRSFDCTRAERLLIYLDDPVRALGEMVRVTRPGGSIALIEPDFDTNTINVGPRDVTRRILAHECDHAVVQGWLVRDLRSLLGRLGATAIEIASRMVVYDAGLAASYFARASLSAMTDGAITAEEQDRWARQVAARHQAGTLFCSVGYYLFTARLPGGA